MLFRVFAASRMLPALKGPDLSAVAQSFILISFAHNDCEITKNERNMNNDDVIFKTLLGFLMVIERNLALVM
ncbi:MAG TPA: hypothetical protein QF623_04800, partial [SAR324 cluster bacterium]|nr:hypothetical protein [SAR324 cluster bacterium]